MKLHFFSFSSFAKKNEENGIYLITTFMGFFDRCFVAQLFEFCNQILASPCLPDLTLDRVGHKQNSVIKS